MNASTPPSPHVAAPGTERPRRFRPKLRYELIGCGLHGHEILGTDAAALRAEDELLIVTTRKRRELAERRLRAVSRRGPLAYWFDEYGAPD